MKQVDDIILKLTSDKSYQERFKDGEDFDVFSIEKFRENGPYFVSEKVFERLIEFAKMNNKNNKLFEDIEPFISNNVNITDLIFKKLLEFAKDNNWIYLGLCHAELDDKKISVLKSLNLDESLWY